MFSIKSISKLIFIIAMCKIFRWTGYVLTLLGAILIIMAVIGIFRCHHQFHNTQVQTCCTMQKQGGDKAVSKDDSASFKQHSMGAEAPMMTTCGNKHVMCSSGAPMMCMGGQMYLHRIAFHMGLAICFLLLAIVLLLISYNCKCKKCCDHTDGRCECKEEKKE